MWNNIKKKPNLSSIIGKKMFLLKKNKTSSRKKKPHQHQFLHLKIRPSPSRFVFLMQKKKNRGIFISSSQWTIFFYSFFLKKSRTFVTSFSWRYRWWGGWIGCVGWVVVVFLNSLLIISIFKPLLGFLVSFWSSYDPSSRK